MNSYKHSSLLKCISCGVAILFLGAELGPGAYDALCDPCRAHINHLSKHNHQEEHRPFNVANGIRSVIVSTTTATATTAGNFFLTS
jgi:hypothetical protein